LQIIHQSIFSADFDLWSANQESQPESMCTYENILQLHSSSVGRSRAIIMTPSFVGVDVDNYFKPVYLFNEMLGHLVGDSFLVYELQKHRACWKGAVLINVISLIFIVLGQHC
jgi:ribosomal protein S19